MNVSPHCSMPALIDVPWYRASHVESFRTPQVKARKRVFWWRKSSKKTLRIRRPYSCHQEHLERRIQSREPYYLPQFQAIMSSSQMKALHYDGPFKVSVKDIPMPKIEHPDDAIIKITTTCICGSDLHMYEGRTAAQPGLVFGHENMGCVKMQSRRCQSLTS